MGFYSYRIVGDTIFIENAFHKQNKQVYMDNRNVTDTQGRVWRRNAIPDGVILANGQSKEKIQKELQKKKERRKEEERRCKEKARRKAEIEREKARKEWEKRPKLYIPLWGINDNRIQDIKEPK